LCLSGHRIAARLAVTHLPALMLIAPDGSISQRWYGFTDAAILAQSIEKQLGQRFGQMPNPPP
jgi:hypothetical protein